MYRILFYCVLSLMLLTPLAWAAEPAGLPPEVVRVQQKFKLQKRPQRLPKRTPIRINLPSNPSPHVIHRLNPRYRATIFPGSLKMNIQRIAQHYHWTDVVWAPDYDFKWVGQTKIQAQSFPDLLSKVLANYPLQAVFYEGNHVLLIRPRTLR